MANANLNATGPNATYIPPARIGSMDARLGSVDARVGSMRVFGCQHVGICNAKVLRLGYYPTRIPNARGFVLQWNTAFMLSEIILFLE